MRLQLRYSLSYLLTREDRLHQRLNSFFLYYYDYGYVHARDHFHLHVFNDANDRVYALFYLSFHLYGRVYHDFHGYFYASLHVCVHAHPFFHDYVNDYAFFINDLTNVPSLCDHDVHLQFLQNHHL